MLPSLKELFITKGSPYYLILKQAYYISSILLSAHAGLIFYEFPMACQFSCRRPSACRATRGSDVATDSAWS
jgi:hypothetical protein